MRAIADNWRVILFAPRRETLSEKNIQLYSMRVRARVIQHNRRRNNSRYEVFDTAASHLRRIQKGHDASGANALSVSSRISPRPFHPFLFFLANRLTARQNTLASLFARPCKIDKRSPDRALSPHLSRQRVRYFRDVYIHRGRVRGRSREAEGAADSPAAGLAERNFEVDRLIGAVSLGALNRV